MSIVEGHFEIGGEEYYERRWPVNAAKGTVVIVHGYGEHCGRYDHVAAAMNAAGYDVFSYDQRWHGRSPGKRSYIEDFERLPRDLNVFLQHARKAMSGEKYFIFAHSMGGLVTTRFLQQFGAPAGLKGVVFSSPFLQLPDDVSPLLIKLADVLGKYLPWLPVSKLNPGAISKDPAEVTKYERDPLNNHKPIVAKSGSQLNMAVTAARAAMDKIAVPFHVFHGDADQLAMVGGSKLLHAQASSRDKELKIYPGGYHELFNDAERDEVLRTVVGWLDARN
jgi:acylglycerol lipase